MEIKVLKDILGANDAIAGRNQKRVDEHHILAINVMSSPGSGKTSVILQTINKLRDKVRIAVIEGDIASNVDAQKVHSAGVPVVQINTAGGCHLDANMVENALNNLPLKEIDLLFIENVGNLVCPAEFSLGEHRKVMLLSMPEGDDKPLKYPLMFTLADVVLINKTDLSPYLDFDIDTFRKTVSGMNSRARLFPISCKTGEGLEQWYSWLLGELEDRKVAQHGKDAGR